MLLSAKESFGVWIIVEFTDIFLELLSLVWVGILITSWMLFISSSEGNNSLRNRFLAWKFKFSWSSILAILLSSILDVVFSFPSGVRCFLIILIGTTNSSSFSSGTGLSVLFNTLHSSSDTILTIWSGLWRSSLK
jgi:hypothetical protein